MYIILKLKIKQQCKAGTKEKFKVIGIIILSFILMSTSLVIAYEPLYETKTEEKISEYVQEEPLYRYYAVTLNNKTKARVETIEEAEEIVEKIKSEYTGNDLKLNLTINEEYTENLEEVTTDTIEVAELSVEKEINKMLEKKEAKEAIATINGINVSVLPVSGQISSRFGVRSSIRSGSHTGLDIACSKGTKIKALSKGKVIFAKYSGSYGNLVKIDHGNGVETWYAHCSRILTKVGTKVKAGDIIAEVGSTGNATGPHLHLEIRINGTAVNPQKYLYK